MPPNGSTIRETNEVGTRAENLTNRSRQPILLGWQVTDKHSVPNLKRPKFGMLVTGQLLSLLIVMDTTSQVWEYQVQPRA